MKLDILLNEKQRLGGRGLMSIVASGIGAAHTMMGEAPRKVGEIEGGDGDRATTHTENCKKDVYLYRKWDLLASPISDRDRDRKKRK